MSELLPSFQPLLVVQDADLRSGLELWQRHERLGCFDAILAVATRRSALTMVSADKAFGRIRDLDVVVPDQQGVDSLIAG